MRENEKKRRKQQGMRMSSVKRNYEDPIGRRRIALSAGMGINATRLTIPYRNHHLR